MTTRTEVDGFSTINYAFGWDVGGTPQNGDTFVVPTGTAIMVGGNFDRSEVDLTRQFNASTQSYAPNPELYLVGNTKLGKIDVSTLTPDQSGAHLNVIGHATVGETYLENIYPWANLTVKLSPGSVLKTHFVGHVRVNSVTVNGGNWSALINDGDSTVQSAVISANVLGHGSWTPGSYFGGITFAAGVGAGQTVDMSGASTLTIDHPDMFKAAVNLETGWVSDIMLESVHGDAWTYKNDMLKISEAGHVVDKLRLTEASGSAFTVTDTTAGTRISASVLPQESAGVILHVS